MLLQKYLEIVNNMYAEPKNEEIIGYFIVSCMEYEQKRTAPTSSKKERIPKQKTTTQGADIRDLLRRIVN